MNTTNLKLCYWNSDGINNKKEELIQFLQEHQIDVLLLGETWLTTGSRFTIPNYNTYRNDRTDQPGGGTAICVKKSISHYLYSSTDGDIENTVIIVKTSKTLLKLIAAYCPPNKRVSRNQLRQLMDGEYPTIMMGDLNAKHVTWGCHTTNTSGRRLLEYIDTSNVELYVPNEPTHFGGQGRPDILDIGLSCGLPTLPQLQTSTNLSSDHNCILWQINLVPEYNKKEIITTNWTKFHYALINNLTPIRPLYSKEDIDKEITNFTEEIQRALSLATKKFKISESHIILPHYVRELLIEKRRAVKRAQQTRDPSHKTRANQLIVKLRTTLNIVRNERWKEKINELNGDLKGGWKLAKSLKAEHTSHAPLRGPNGPVYSDQSKVEVFAGNLEDQFSLNNLGDADTDNRVKQSVEMFLHESAGEETLHPAKYGELKNIIKNLKRRKAPGMDGIPNQALKMFPKKAEIKLLNIINACLRQNYFPTAWKEAHVIMLPKQGKNLTLPTNYRPISLLPQMAKILERFILLNLQDEISHKHLLPDEQFGFRPNHSAVQQAFRITELISNGFINRDHTAALFLDVEKAFDKVWHQGLIHKLILMKIKKPIIKIIQSFLENRICRVRIRQELSRPRQINAGVPQGSVLGPILYTLFTSDCPNDSCTELALFADDTVQTATSRNPELTINKLQQAIDNLHDWFRKWKIKVNADKCQAVFYSRSNTAPPDHLYVENLRIPWTNEAKYLGITIDKKLTWTKHVSITNGKGRGLVLKLRPLLKSQQLNTKTKLLLYNSLILPVITYGAPVWGYTCKTNLNKIQVVQNKTLRTILGAPWFIRNEQIHRELNYPTIRDRVTLQAKKLFETAENHQNPLIRKAADYQLTDGLRPCKRPRLLLNAE